MSNKSNRSKANKAVVTEELVETPVEEVSTEEEKVAETPAEEKKVEEVKTFKGVVAGCEKLRVRKAPTTVEDNTVRIINAGTKLLLKEYNDTWFETADGEFVMSKFVTRI
jgi:hypothetical protein